MRVNWKWVGLAGAAGVATTGAVVVVRNRRTHRDYEPDELRERLHRRMAEMSQAGDGSGDAAPAVERRRRPV